MLGLVGSEDTIGGSVEYRLVWQKELQYGILGNGQLRQSEYVVEFEGLDVSWVNDKLSVVIGIGLVVEVLDGGC